MINQREAQRCGWDVRLLPLWTLCSGADARVWSPAGPGHSTVGAEQGSCPHGQEGAQVDAWMVVPPSPGAFGGLAGSSAGNGLEGLYNVWLQQAAYALHEQPLHL